MKDINTEATIAGLSNKAAAGLNLNVYSAETDVTKLQEVLRTRESAYDAFYSYCNDMSVENEDELKRQLTLAGIYHQGNPKSNPGTYYGWIVFGRPGGENTSKVLMRKYNDIPINDRSVAVELAGWLTKECRCRFVEVAFATGMTDDSEINIEDCGGRSGVLRK